MSVQDVRVIEHSEFAADYKLIKFECPSVSSQVVPGQFIHLLIPKLDGGVLRRPFSIFMADSETLSVLYKPVGHGTFSMASIVAGDTVSIIAPLGNGFPEIDSQSFPVLVAGGYGVAPLYLLASRMTKKGVLFVGGRTETDILCVDLFRELGWEVQVATEDASLGVKGYVTAALDRWLENIDNSIIPEYFVCGPDGLLHAIGDRAVATDKKGWLSLDKHMGCGVGACLACVQKIRLGDGSVVWKRVCKDGPVFEASEIVWDE